MVTLDAVVSATANDDGTSIDIITSLEQRDGAVSEVIHRFSERVSVARGSEIRAALIQLGWTPPPEG